MRKRSEDDQGERETEERQARQAEASVFALEDEGSETPPMVSSAPPGAEPRPMDQDPSQRSSEKTRPGEVEVDERELEVRVWTLLESLLRRERDRAGRAGF